jgi:predicted dehydrogenase
MYPQVSPEVHVYAPVGPDLNSHLGRINDFNSRTENPTHWVEKIYSGPDYLSRMLAEKAGNVVVIAGNNTRKTEYINDCVKAGFNVLADKPMAITPEGFNLLRAAFEAASKNNVLLYDIMTERYEITSILQRELAQNPEVFGTIDKGSDKDPAVELDSVHYFFKEVAGKPLIRPAWFFDPRQEGEAIPDVGTHLVDAVQWICFPERSIDWRKDIKVQNARRWPTKVSLDQFRRATGEKTFPDFLKKDIDPKGQLQVFQNGSVNYTLRGVHVKVTARWDFEAAPGAKDSLYSRIRGTGCSLLIKQGPEQHFQATLYVEPRKASGQFEEKFRATVLRIAQRYPGVGLKKSGSQWEVTIPDALRVGHEAHFAQVTEHFLKYLAERKLPAWEVPNMLAKYYTATEAYRLSHKQGP